MRRRLFNLAAAVSLVLCLAVVVLWVRSQWVTEQVSLVRAELGPQQLNEHSLALRIGGGLVRLQRRQETTTFHKPDVFDSVKIGRRHGLRVQYHRDDPGDMAPYQARSFLNRVGFYASFEKPNVSIRDYDLSRRNTTDVRLELEYTLTTFDILVFPLWLLVIGFALLPGQWAVRRWLVRSRARRGRCPACGYDLRATPDRCPECGTARTDANQPTSTT